MTQTEHAEIIEYLQATRPQLATRLTLERIALIGEIRNARAAAWAECRERAAKMAESYGYRCRVDVIDAIRSLEMPHE